MGQMYSVVGGDHSHSLICLAIQVQEAVLDWLLASFLLEFVYVSVYFQYHNCYDINTVYMARLGSGCVGIHV